MSRNATTSGRGRTSWKTIWLFSMIVFVVALASWVLMRQASRESVEQTRQALRKAGFKTELADFNFSAPADMRTRNDIIGRFDIPEAFTNDFFPILMPVTGTNSALVVWQPTWLQTENGEKNWASLHEFLVENEAQLDEASQAALEGPLRFNVMLKGFDDLNFQYDGQLALARILEARVAMELHEGNIDYAWTNLLAATRLAAAWQPEPFGGANWTRSQMVKSSVQITWQALQTNGWSDDQLARLQREWENVDFFTNLPEVVAFQRAQMSALCDRVRRLSVVRDINAVDFLRGAYDDPSGWWRDFKELCSILRYRGSALDWDEKSLLLYYQKNELEVRQAVQSPTWAAMSGLPGVTNEVVFHAASSSLIQDIFEMTGGWPRTYNEHWGLLGDAAENESWRRIIITAIALERYRGRHGGYPDQLSAMAPELIKAPPLDFMDGQPLRYRRTGDGHFILYSIGLDGIDNGGNLVSITYLPNDRRGTMTAAKPVDFQNLTNADLVWPRPATAGEVALVHQVQLAAKAAAAATYEETNAAVQWARSDQQQRGVSQLLRNPDPQRPEPMYHGRRLSEILYQPPSPATNAPTLRELLALKQVITGEEPDRVTFELPLKYDMLVQLGSLHLFIDSAAAQNSNDRDDMGQVEVTRTTNGTCRLVWNTTYEASGPHALKAGLLLNESVTPNDYCTGPFLPFATTNLCQLAAGSATFDPEIGVTFHARLQETNATYAIEINSPEGVRLKSITGGTSSGVLKEFWNLQDDQGCRLTNDTFNFVLHVTLPVSGRTETLKGVCRQSHD